MKKLLGVGFVLVVVLGLAVGESLARGGGGRGGGGSQRGMRGRSTSGQYGSNAQSAAMQQMMIQNRYRMMMQNRYRTIMPSGQGMQGRQGGGGQGRGNGNGFGQQQRLQDVNCVGQAGGDVPLSPQEIQMMRTRLRLGQGGIGGQVPVGPLR